MGELIKKVAVLEIGGAKFDVEINEPLSVDGQRQIHLQNSNFRQNFSESEFFQVAACLLLARKQFDIIKTKPDSPEKSSAEPKATEKQTYIDKSVIVDFFRLLNDANLSYVVLHNIDGELPGKLKHGKDIDILVAESEQIRFEELMTSNGFSRITHPFGRENGWNFGYQLPEYQFWKKGKGLNTFYADVCFKLCCKSLTPQTWIPLDASTNTYVFENRLWNAKNQWWQLDNDTHFLHLIVRSIFDKHGFSDGYVDAIESLKLKIDQERVEKFLSLVFFRYTPRLLSLIAGKEYHKILQDFITSTDY
ncbi:hypothetical protein FACS1894202_07650 [Clostridia bacterium]|nr:hypothetical protein FACS1894202_07650 [Clostridia bacterium]